MKMVWMTAGILIILVNSVFAADSVEERRSWTEQFAVTASAPVLEIQNIWGDVHVLPGRDGEISVKIEERRWAPNQVLYERSLELLKLDIQAGDEGVSLYVGEREHRWHRKNPCRGCRLEYQFEVHVPVSTVVNVSTVNDGQVEVSGISGLVSAGNVNGPISISAVKNCGELENINGAVTLGFASAPGKDCHIETINGDITLEMPKGAGLDVAMDLFNGRMVSEFEVDPLAIPAKVEHTRSDGRNHYRIAQPAGVRIAGGGPTFTISSMNGDIRIQKTQ